jgi:hypothetical protein
VFKFEDESEEPVERRPRMASMSGAFLAMIGLTVVAMLAVGLVLFWAVGVVQN